MSKPPHAAVHQPSDRLAAARSAAAAETSANQAAADEEAAIQAALNAKAALERMVSAAHVAEARAEEASDVEAARSHAVAKASRNAEAAQAATDRAHAARTASAEDAARAQAAYDDAARAEREHNWEGMAEAVDKAQDAADSAAKHQLDAADAAATGRTAADHHEWVLPEWPSKVRNWLVSEYPPGTAPTPPDEARANNLAKWTATGFSLLAGLLAFFGVREAVLNRVVSSWPDTVAWVFVFVGAGVIATYLACLAPNTLRVPVVLMLGIIAGALILGYAKFHTVHPVAFNVTWQWEVVIGALLALLVLLCRPWHLPLTSAVLIVGTVALAIGLYGALAISSASKKINTPIAIVPTVTREADARTATVSLDVRGSGLRMDSELRVAMYEMMDDGNQTTRLGALLGQALIPSAIDGTITGTVTFAVPADVHEAAATAAECYVQPHKVQPLNADSSNAAFSTSTTQTTAAVWMTPINNTKDLVCESGPNNQGNVYARFLVQAGTPPKPTPSPALAASLTAGSAEGTVAALVTGMGLPADGTVEIAVAVSAADVTTATLHPDSNGVLRWEATVPAAGGAMVVLRAGTTGNAEATATAKYLAPNT